MFAMTESTEDRAHTTAKRVRFADSTLPGKSPKIPKRVAPATVLSSIGERHLWHNCTPNQQAAPLFAYGPQLL